MKDDDGVKIKVEETDDGESEDPSALEPPTTPPDSNCPSEETPDGDGDSGAVSSLPPRYIYLVLKL